VPELPEVETIRQTLAPHLLGRHVTGLEVFQAKFLRNATPAEFAQAVIGQEICALQRRGKYLLLELASGDAVVVHLRMTGRLLLCHSNQERERHTHVVLILDDGRELRYADQRTFGGFFLVRAAGTGTPRGLATLGPEPLGPAFSQRYLSALAAKRRLPIKGLLLNQELIAGIGNIYADESLFRAGIDPRRPANSLSQTEVRRLHRAIRQVLQDGISKHGTTFSDYVDGEGRPGDFVNYLNVYQRAGEPCRRCGTPIQKVRCAARGTHFCPQCQL